MNDFDINRTRPRYYVGSHGECVQSLDEDAIQAVVGAVYEQVQEMQREAGYGERTAALRANNAARAAAIRIIDELRNYPPED